MRSLPLTLWLMNYPRAWGGGVVLVRDWLVELGRRILPLVWFTLDRLI